MILDAGDSIFKLESDARFAVLASRTLGSSESGALRFMRE